MVRSCSLKNCTNSVKQKFRFFLLPSVKKVAKRTAWLRKCGHLLPENLPRSGNSISLCEGHFEPDQFVEYGPNVRTILKPTAVPTIFLKNPSRVCDAVEKKYKKTLKSGLPNDDITFSNDISSEILSAEQNNQNQFSDASKTQDEDPNSDIPENPQLFQVAKELLSLSETIDTEDDASSNVKLLRIKKNCMLVATPTGKKVVPAGEKKLYTPGQPLKPLLSIKDDDEDDLQDHSLESSTLAIIGDDNHADGSSDQPLESLISIKNEINEENVPTPTNNMTPIEITYVETISESQPSLVVTKPFKKVVLNVDQSSRCKLTPIGKNYIRLSSVPNNNISFNNASCVSNNNAPIVCNNEPLNIKSEPIVLEPLSVNTAKSTESAQVDNKNSLQTIIISHISQQPTFNLTSTVASDKAIKTPQLSSFAVPDKAIKASKVTPVAAPVQVIKKPKLTSMVGAHKRIKRLKVTPVATSKKSIEIPNVSLAASIASKAKIRNVEILRPKYSETELEHRGLVNQTNETVASDKEEKVVLQTKENCDCKILSCPNDSDKDESVNEFREVIGTELKAVSKCEDSVFYSPVSTDLKTLRKRIQKVEAERDYALRKYRRLAIKMEVFYKNLQIFLNDDQIRTLETGSSTVQWSPETLQRSAKIRCIVGPKAYEYLRNKEHFPLPSFRTLYRYRDISKLNEYTEELLQEHMSDTVNKVTIGNDSEQSDTDIEIDKEILPEHIKVEMLDDSFMEAEEDNEIIVISDQNTKVYESEDPSYMEVVE